MIVDKVKIKRFRGFVDQIVDFGEINIIIGQNGTQKTTLMGIITQGFTNKDSYFKDEKTFLDKSFQYKVSDIIKFSNNVDKAGDHRWTLYSKVYTEGKYALKSFNRSGTSNLRFYNADSRTKGDGYSKVPIIYLSLGRVNPIVESSTNGRELDKYIKKNEEEIKKHYQKIFKTFHEEDIKFQGYSKGKIRNFGIKSDSTDFFSSSSGQDNISQILLSVYSFKYLKEKYKDQYEGGILIIDELETTLHPFSQKELFKFLKRQGKNLKIQIFFTTHSDIILREYEENYILDPNVKLIYLEKRGGKISIESNPNYGIVFHSITGQKIMDQNESKYEIIREDKEAEIVAKELLRNKVYLRRLKFENFNLGCNQILTLNNTVPYFNKRLIILDGDAKSSKLYKKNQKNIVFLPGKFNPEKTIYEYAKKLDDDDSIWIRGGFTKQHVINAIEPSNIDDRVKSKKWFNEMLEFDDKQFKKLIKKCYLEGYKEESNCFIENIIEKTDQKIKK